jgi:ABC-type nitrate/sulfonate/bicarbonate transport system substrate-binding protein
MARQRTPLTTAFVAAALAALALGACSSTGGSTGSTGSTGATGSTGSPTTAPSAGEVTAAGIPPARCAANKAAGRITYLSGFDFSASASIVEVIVAQQKGYFEKMCLDVDLKASFSTANYPLVAANEAQFASAGSYAEIADYDQANDAGLVVVAIDGKTAIDSLIVKEGEGAALTDLKGKTIGVKGKLPPSIKAMLAKAGMVEGKDYTTVGIEGFDPLVHIKLPGLAGFPGYKSNEPGTLERAGIPFTLFDPSKDGIPGSFGVIYTNAGFLTEHPTAAQDFVRASMRGMEDALADPKAAAQAAVDLINANGNKNFLSPEGEQFRWTPESGLVAQFTPTGQPVGLIDPADLQSQIDAYDAVGIFTEKPTIDGTYDASLIAGVYGPDGKVVWPSG